MVDALPPPKTPFQHLDEVERELDWQENQLRRRNPVPSDLLPLTLFATGTALLAGLLWWLF